MPSTTTRYSVSERSGVSSSKSNCSKLYALSQVPVTAGKIVTVDSDMPNWGASGAFGTIRSCAYPGSTGVSPASGLVETIAKPPVVNSSVNGLAIGLPKMSCAPAPMVIE